MTGGNDILFPPEKEPKKRKEGSKKDAEVELTHG